MQKIGIVGCGTIGTEIASAIDAGNVKNASLVVLFDRLSSPPKKLRKKLPNSNPLAFSKLSEFFSSAALSEADIIVEAASKHAVKQLAKRILTLNKSLVIMSTGALSDSSLLNELSSTLDNHMGKIYIPTGAIAGIDAIRSVRNLLDSVTLTTTKNPKALVDAPFFNSTNIRIDKIKKKTLLY